MTEENTTAADEAGLGTREMEMTADDWTDVAEEARQHAIGWLASKDEVGRAGRLERAAALLQASDTFHARANILYLSGGTDKATVEE